MASTNFINECKNRTNKNRLGKITLIDDNIEINNSNNLKNFIIENSCYSNGNIIGTIFVKKVTSEFVGLSDNVDLIDKKINVQAGVKYANTTTEFVNLGRYIVERPTDLQTSDKDKIIAYDYLSDKLEDEYECNLDYSNNNITVSDLYVDVCNQLNLIPVTTTFLNSNITIQNNPFKNHEKNRTVLNAVATVACSFVTVDMDNNKIDLSWLSSSIEPEYTFEKNDYAVLEGGKIVYGPINSVTIKNSQIDDENVTRTDSESIALNGEHSIIISEDYILYNTTLRQQAITGIFNRLDGLRYTDCKLTTYYGKPFMKIGTKIRVRTDNGYFDTYVLSHKFSYDGSFVSEISSPALTEQEIKTKQNRTLGKLLSDTQIQIDKQKQQILANVTSIQQVNQKANTLETNLNTTNSNLATTNTNLNNLQTQVNGISADFDDFYDNEYIQSIDNLQSQIDGQIQFWNGPDIPTINNYPTNQWTTEADKNNHRADIYTVIEDVQGELKQGKSYRFDKVNNVWQWIELTDNELSAVQAIANEANNRSKANASDITVLQEQDATFQMNLNSIDARVTNNETTIQEIIDTEDEKTGNPITTEEALANKLLDFEIEGNSYQNSRILPEEYTQVEYLESTDTTHNTNYIETGIYPTNNTSIEVEFEFNQQSMDWSRVFGSSNLFRNEFSDNNKGLQIYYGTQARQQYQTVYVDTKYKIKQDKNKTYINENLFYTFQSETFTDTNVLRLFSATTGNRDSKIKMYYAKIWENNVLVRYYIPCYRNSDNVIGLYDLVNDVFYTNQGTGSFTYGNIVSIPNPDYPQPVQVVSGSNTITICGKNLFDKGNTTIYSGYFTAGGKISSKGIDNSDNKWFYIPCKPNTTYTITKPLQSTQSRNRFRLGTTTTTPNANDLLNDFWYMSDGGTTTTHTITTGANANFLCMYYTQSTSNTDNAFEVLNGLQIEYGNQATTYSPYQEQNYEINLGKNLLPFTNQNFTISGINFYVANGNLYLNGSTNGEIYTSNNSYKNNFSFILNPGTYTFSFNSTTTNSSSIKKKNDDTTLGTAINGVSKTSTTFTLTEETECYLGLYIYRQNFDNQLMKFQLERNNQATSYSPYFTPIELCKIGDYKDEIRKSIGKNLFDVSQGFKNGYLNTSTGVFTSENQSFVSNQYIEVNGGNTYCYSLNKNVENLSIYSFDQNKNYIKREIVVWGRNKVSITVDNNAKYVVLGGNYNNSTTVTQEILNSLYIQFENGTERTNIEPYGTGVWYKYKEIGKVVLDGSENFYMSGKAIYTTIQNAYCLSNQNADVNSGNIDYILSNYFSINGLGAIYNNGATGVILFYMVNNPSEIRLTFGMGNITVNDFKTWLSTHNTEVYYVLETPTYEIIENQELINTLNNIELFEGINTISFSGNLDTDIYIKYLLKTPLSDSYMTRSETEAEINIKANQILEKVQEVNDETISINQRVQTLTDTTSTISTNLNNNYQTADATNAQIQTTKDDITQIQSQVSEVRQTLTDFNISLSTMSGTLNNMSYNFNTDRLKIAKSNDPINSELSNEGVKIYNYSTLSAIFTNKGSGIDKLIVTGTAQIGYLKIVKAYKNNKKCTTIHVLNQLIEDLEDLESDD